MTNAELEAPGAELQRYLEELRAYELAWGATVQAGDMAPGTQDREYTYTKERYETEGKLYTVLGLDRRLGYVYAICAGDFQPNLGVIEKVWIGPGAFIVRDGCKILERPW